MYKVVRTTILNLESDLNRYAGLGWRVVSCTPEHPNRYGTEGFTVLMEGKE